MEHLSLKTLALAGLTALALSGTAVITAGPAEAQGRGGYEEIDAPGDDLDGPRVQRGVDVDEDDELPPVRRRVIDDEEDERRIIERRTTERRITERRVVEPVIERRVIERRPVVQEIVERPVVHTTVVRPVVERRIVQPVFVRPVVERRVVRPVVYAYPRPVVRRVVYRSAALPGEPGGLSAALPSHQPRRGARPLRHHGQHRARPVFPLLTSGRALRSARGP